MKLERDVNGSRTATDGSSGAEESKLVSLASEDIQANSGETEIMIPLKPVYTTEAGLNLDKLPLTILVNDRSAAPDESGCYIGGNLGIYAGYYNTGDAFAVCNADNPYDSPVPDGAYTIQITVSVPDGAVVHIRDNRKSFQDTRNHWARSAIDFVSSRELFSGTSAGTFSPDTPMSRAMLYRYAGSPAATDRELRFSDAENISSYAREAIRWAAEHGILSGYGDGSFAPKDRATRGQTAAILERYVRWLSQR